MASDNDEDEDGDDDVATDDVSNNDNDFLRTTSAAGASPGSDARGAMDYSTPTPPHSGPRPSPVNDATSSLRSVPYDDTERHAHHSAVGTSHDTSSSSSSSSALPSSTTASSTSTTDIPAPGSTDGPMDLTFLVPGGVDVKGSWARLEAEGALLRGLQCGVTVLQVCQSYYTRP